MEKWTQWLKAQQMRFLDFIFAGAEIEVNRMSDDYQVAKYILDVLYENISKFMITGGIAMVLGIGKYFLFFTVVYGSLKYFAYGAHLDNSLLRLISGAVTYYGSIYLAHYKIPEFLYLLVFFLGLCIYRRYAPAVSKEQFLHKTRFRILKRWVQVYIILLFCIHFMISDIYRNLIVFALMAEAINILPIAFAVFEVQERGRNL